MVPGSILGAEDTVVNKTERLGKTETLFPELTFWQREIRCQIYTYTHSFRLSTIKRRRRKRL